MRLINHHKRWYRGFTLIELLVVVFLIGLISGFVVLSVSTVRDDREIEDQIRLLQYQLAMASEESIVQGRPLGVQLEQGRYSFLIAGKSKWKELNDGKIFRSMKLQQGWKFELLIGSENMPFAKGEDGSSKTKSVPQIIFYSSGEIDPFEILIVDESHTPKFRIKYGDKGEITLESVGDS